MEGEPTKKKPKSDIRAHFGPREHQPETDEQPSTSADAEQPALPDPGPVPAEDAAPVPDPAPSEDAAAVAQPAAPLDIGRVFVDSKRDLNLVRTLDDNDRKSLLTNHWMPGENFQYPCTAKGGKRPQNIYLGEKHITGEYGCFKYSPALRGVGCVPCVIFCGETAENNRGKGTILGQLVNKPLQKYSHLTGSGGSLTDHLGTEYHKNCQKNADNFLRSLRDNTDIRTKLDADRARHVREQRDRIVPIIKTTILCGRLGVGYRGRKDAGVLDPDEPIARGDGNFRALLSFRVDSGDEKLRQHLATAGKNATMISGKTQNELIGLCGDVVRDQIVRKANEAQFFSVIADETTDASHHEQLCLCIRFVSKEAGIHKVSEEFIQFETARDLTGAGLGEQILYNLRVNGLDINNLVGQGYDGAASMSGHIKGAQTYIRKEVPAALYVHCGSHVLNLVLNSASIVPEIRNMFSTVREVTNFINSSGKRREALEKIMEDNAQALKTLCETRFVERHDALLIFCDHFVAIVECLEQLVGSDDRTTSDSARTHLRAMTTASFIIALCCAKKLMALTVMLSQSLQTVDSDLVKAIASVGQVTSTLTQWRNSGQADWMHPVYGPFNNACKLAKNIDVPIAIPRLAARQTKRNNIPASTCEEYYKRAIWFPYLDAVISSITDRFSSHQQLVLKMSALVPSAIHNYQWSDVVKTFKMYQTVIGNPNEEAVMHEYHGWKEFCSSMEAEQRPSDSVQALDIAPERFPNIKKLIQICATIPVTTCTAERAFSAMKILKDYLRNKTTDARLTGLALMYIHTETNIDIEEVIDRFAALKNRRLDFLL